MTHALHRFIDPLSRRVAMLVGRALVKLIDDAGGMQLLQLEGLDGEVLSDVEHAQPYGLASAPLAGATGVLLAVGGVRANAVVINVGDRRYRLKGLIGGEVALYDDQGQAVHLKRDQVLVTSPFKVVVEAPEVFLGGEAGALAVARVGDPVAGGVISAGSTIVKAV